MSLADELPRFVRVRGFDARGFVEFEFAIGDPSLHLDMILPPLAFREFCREQRVRYLGTPAAEASVPESPAEES